ncbi:hypothetical protein V6N11_025667 [Hibiscus sabdariffa]|uniref:Uncharacterized protein n=1 Tax=Hibiscus sabdariffa TaxID=183260 RepID=A0ABR2SU63_9ROSI
MPSGLHFDAKPLQLLLSFIPEPHVGLLLLSRLIMLGGFNRSHKGCDENGVSHKYNSEDEFILDEDMELLDDAGVEEVGYSHNLNIVLLHVA